MPFNFFKSDTPNSFKDSQLRNMECWVIDGEMSGCSPRKHSIISFVAIPIRKKRLLVAEAKEWKIKPQNLKIDPRSMVIHKLTEEDISQGMDEATACKEIAACLNHQTLVGHNIGFDLDFLKQLFNTHNIECSYNTTVDTGKLMKWYLNRINPHITPDPSALKIENVIHSMELPQYPPHDAFNDTVMVGALFLKLLHNAQQEGYTNLKELIRLH